MFLYELAKNVIRVDNVWRNSLLEEPKDDSRRCTADVAIAVCVTLMGIITFLTGALSNICAASASKCKGQTNRRLGPN